MTACAAFAPRAGAQSDTTGASPPPEPATAETAPAAGGTTPADAATPSASPPGLASLAWLEGCWKGTVNRREFREVWLPQRGGMMLGVSQTVIGDKTIDFEFLRLEPRSDAVYYVVSPPGKPEEAFRLTRATTDQEDAHIFSFTDARRDFPSEINYRQASEGWLYTEVKGKVKNAERKVIYPMRRIDCESGELIRK